MAAPPPLLPALITPFDDSGELDLDAHRFNIKALNGQGITGFLIAGSTGEGPYLDPGERRSLVSSAREELPDTYLMCGIAAETVRQAQAMISEAASGGADAALVITPTTLTRNRSQLVGGYYQQLAAWSPLPLFLYSVPSVTAFELPEDLVVELSQHSNIIGMKDSGGHPVRMQRLVANSSAEFKLFNGSTQAVTLAIAAGAYGAITASTNYLAPEVLRTIDLARQNPLEARELQRRISEVSAGIEALGIPGVKAASELVGLRPGVPRSPLLPLPEEQRAKVARLLRQ